MDWIDGIFIVIGKMRSQKSFFEYTKVMFTAFYVSLKELIGW